MKFTGITYRPPPEANTLLLQVTAGCAHNKCTYCSMYSDVKFKVEKLEQIERDLQEAQSMYGSHAGANATKSRMGQKESF